MHLVSTRGVKKVIHVCRIICHGGGVLARLGVGFIGLSLARGSAVRAFARELHAQGLPEDVVEMLSAEYPTLKDFSSATSVSKTGTMGNP